MLLFTEWAYIQSTKKGFVFQRLLLDFHILIFGLQRFFFERQTQSLIFKYIMYEIQNSLWISRNKVWNSWNKITLWILKSNILILKRKVWHSRNYLCVIHISFLILFVYVFYFNLRTIPIAPSVGSAGVVQLRSELGWTSCGATRSPLGYIFRL